MTNYTICSKCKKCVEYVEGNEDCNTTWTICEDCN